MKTPRSPLLRVAAALAAAATLGLGIASLRGGDAPELRNMARPPKTAHHDRHRSGPTLSAMPAVTHPAPRHPAGFEALPGDLFRYRLDARWTARIEPSQEESRLEWVGGTLPARVTTRFRGRLEVAVVSREEREYVLRIVARDPVASISAGATAQRFDSDELARPVFVRFASDGKVLGYAFEPGVSEHSQSLLVGAIALSHQFVVRDQPAPWTVSKLRDDVGPFSARFAWASAGAGADAVVTRSVLSYDRTSGQSIERSASQARIANGWLASSEAHEERRAHLEGVLTASTSVHVTVDLIDRSTIAVSGFAPNRGQSWQAGPIETSDEDVPITDGAAERMAAIDDPKRALEDTLADIATIATTDDLYGEAGYDALRRLAELARFFPELVLPAMLDLLRSGELDAASQNWLLSALGRAGAAGSAEATAALGEIIADTALPDDVRMAALISAHQLDGHVTAEMIRIATDVLLAGAGGDSPLPTTAALLLGDFAAQGGLPDGVAELIDAGLDLVREVAFERGEPEVYFDALRNSDRSDLIANAFEYLDHPDPAVRRAALDALGGLPDNPRTLDELVRAATQDDSSAARRAALESLTDLPPSPETTDVLRDVAGSDPDAAVRGNAIDALGAQAMGGSSEAYDALVELARSDGESGDRARSMLADVEESRA